MKTNVRPLITSLIVALATATLLEPAAAAAKQKTPPLVSAAAAPLQEKYATMLASLRAEISRGLPKLDAQKRSAFLEAYAAEARPREAVKAAQQQAKSKDPKMQQEAAAALKAAEVAQIAAQGATLAAARPLLADLERFLAGTALDPLLVKCAVIANATPRGLAEFSAKGAEQEQLVAQLLADERLLREMLEAGGAKGGQYGLAMSIYETIRRASPQATKGILQRLALGTSLEQAVPLEGEDNATVDPVKRYRHYEKAFLDGELDTAVSKMTVWECRFITNDPFSDEELAWGRAMLRNYRPDVVSERDYRWRYAKIVKTDVAYKSPEWGAVPGAKAAQLIAGGGKCGPRAWFGRFALRAFGIPTWGVTQPGHAAAGHWTPEGWTINLGAAWKYSWWENRPGEDFLLEAQARRHAAEYLKVLRAEWIGDALDEKKVDPNKPGSGGFWPALALVQKRSIVATAQPKQVALAGEELSEADEPARVESVTTAAISEADKKITIHGDGSVVIPAAACSKPQKNSGAIQFMKSFAGGLQLNANRLGKGTAGFEYTFDLPRAGNYTLVASVVTVHPGQQLQLATNGGETANLPVPYTAGVWRETVPMKISLKAGRNTLDFTRNAPCNGLAIKQLVLKPAN